MLLRDNPRHIVDDSVSLLFRIAVRFIGLPVQPLPAWEHCRHVVGVEIVSDLTQLRDRRLILPRKLGIRSRSRISSEDVVSNLLPLGSVGLCEDKPLVPAFSDGAA